MLKRKIHYMYMYDEQIKKPKDREENRNTNMVSSSNKLKVYISLDHGAIWQSTS